MIGGSLALACAWSSGTTAAHAQTPTIPTIPVPATSSTTVPAGPDIKLRPVPRESDIGPAGSHPIGSQLMRIEISNPTASAVVNQQLVVRFPAAPASVVQGVLGSISVFPGSAEPLAASPVGLIDAKANVWFHTVSNVPANGVVTYTVLWSMPCAGRWSIAARVAERRTIVDPVFRGIGDGRCGSDEEVARRPGSFGDLPWPPGTSVAGATVTLPGTPTTGGDAVSGSAPTSVTSSVVTSSTVPGAAVATTTVSTTSVPATTATTTTATTAAVPTATATTTVRPSTSRPRAARLIVVCKTVRKQRQCRTVRATTTTTVRRP